MLILRNCSSRLALAVLGAILLLAPAHAETDGASGLGGQIRWARLKTQSLTWNRHAHADPRLLQFMSSYTALDIDTKWYAADVEDLDQMCAYPFLFSEGIHHVTDANGLANLREYLQRNGFIFIDSCINTGINPDPDAFLQMEIDTLKSLLPDARIEPIAPGSEIFHICFDMKDGLPHTYMRNIYNPAWAKHGLYAVYSQNRLVSIISLSGLQCGWAGMKRDPENIANCMKMMLNIYVYATTH